jgi:hypothetical protein
MRRFLAAILVIFLASMASEQLAAGQARMAPTQAEIAAQASFDTSYLLWAYMTQLAAAGAAPTQADIDKATQRYFTNGAEITSVPTSGPGAAYFQNGAEVTAYSPSQGTSASEPAGKGASAPSVRGKSSEQEADRPAEDAGRQGTMATTEEAEPIGGAVGHPAPISEVPAEASTASRAELGPPTTPIGLTCSPREIEAAMAIARQFAVAPAPLPSATSSAPPTGSTAVPPPRQTPPTGAAQPVPNCPPEPALNSFHGPSLLSRIAFALSGAFLGGLAVARLRRPRLIVEAASPAATRRPERRQ